jgi:hypothetical protein
VFVTEIFDYDHSPTMGFIQVYRLATAKSTKATATSDNHKQDEKDKDKTNAIICTTNESRH